MFIYCGKLNCDSASNEMITVVFPKGFQLNDPVGAFWQSPNDPKLDNKKASVANSGFICTVTKTSDGSMRRIQFSFNSYGFEGTVTADFETLSLTMIDSMGPYRPFDLTATHVNVANVSSVVVYTGNLKWPPHAMEEMMTIIIPYGITNDAFFGLHYQWTRGPGADDPSKPNVAIEGRFRDVTVKPDGFITAIYEEADYKYEFEFDSDKKGSFVLSHKRRGGMSEVNHFMVAYKL